MSASSYPHSPSWAATWPLGDLAVRAATLWPDAVGLVVDDERRTFAEVDAEAERAGRALLALGVGPGDVVALFLGNSIDYYVLVLGAARVGAVPLLLNARYRGDELRHVLADAAPTVLLTSPPVGPDVDFLERLREALPSLREADSHGPLDLPELPSLRSLVVLGATDTGLDRDSFLAGADGVDPEHVELLRTRVAIRGVAMMMYTSGTTARRRAA